MTNRELQSNFEYKVNKYDSELMLTSDLIFHWLTEAQLDIVEELYAGEGREQGFEQTQLITDSLFPLVKEDIILTTPGLGADKPNSYTATLPTDYMFTVGEEVVIEFVNVAQTEVLNRRNGITQSTSDTYTRQVNDPYSEHILHYETAKPLRLAKENYIELISDGNYQVLQYHLRYIRKPLNLTIDGSVSELPDFIHHKIVDKAVKLYLQSIGEQNN